MQLYPAPGAKTPLYSALGTPKGRQVKSWPEELDLEPTLKRTLKSAKKARM